MPPVLVQGILVREHVCGWGWLPDLYPHPTDNPSCMGDLPIMACRCCGSKAMSILRTKYSQNMLK